jgi:hypothetical protein
MSCAELRRQLNQIDDDLLNFPTMSQVEKDRLIYERMKVNGILRHKIAEILDECEKNA